MDEAVRKVAANPAAVEAVRKTMEFVSIPAGTFMMGDNTSESKRQKPAHQVTISKPFYLGKYEVTQEQWETVMGSNSYLDKEGRSNPVKVTWDDVQVFIRILNQNEGKNKYRLPTEAEWEYAARAGSQTGWFFGENPADLGQYAWCWDNSQGTTHPVGEKKPNPWGLYDIYGNVDEWVADWYGDYQAGAVTDPTGPPSGPGRVHRGGSLISDAGLCGSAVRLVSPPDSTGHRTGFRLAYSPEK